MSPHLINYQTIEIESHIEEGIKCTFGLICFISFAFDTFGFLASDVVDLLYRVQKVMHSNSQLKM